MIPDKTGSIHDPTYDTYDGPISWWSWRPGFKPANALLLGGFVSLALLLLLASSLFVVIAPLLDSTTTNGKQTGSILLIIPLLIVGLIYPITLLRWGLRDFLIERYARDHLCQYKARVIATRAATGSTNRNRPGIMRGNSRPWYGVALLPINEELIGYKKLPVLTFSISEERYQSIREGMLVQIVYSPDLHYVYTLTELRNERSE